MPGVLTILHHGNIGPLYRPAGSLEEMSRPGESRPPFEDENIYYYGQYVALVVADTFEQAQDAAFHVKVSYQSKKPLVRMEQSAVGHGGQRRTTYTAAPRGSHYSRGDAESAYRPGCGQNRLHLRHAGRDPQPHGDARHSRRLGRRPADTVRVSPRAW